MFAFSSLARFKRQWRRNTTKCSFALSKPLLPLSEIPKKQPPPMSRDARRRLSLLCSHLSPTLLNPDPPHSSRVSGSVCASASPSSDDDSSCKKQSLLQDCVFCNIIRGQSPARKVFFFPFFFLFSRYLILYT